jgi:hypothetical protein
METTNTIIADQKLQLQRMTLTGAGYGPSPTERYDAACETNASVSTLHSLASSRRPTRVCVRTSARCTAVSYRCSQKLDLQDQALQYLGHAGSLQYHAH